MDQNNIEYEEIDMDENQTVEPQPIPVELTG